MVRGNARRLCREIYEAYVTRASDQGPGGGRWDNTPVMEATLRLRHEMGADAFGSLDDQAKTVRRESLSESEKEMATIEH